MSADWVTVAIYSEHAQAALAKSLLDSPGLRDEQVSRRYSGACGGAFGGIKPQVRPEAKAPAVEFLPHDCGIPGDEFPAKPES